MANKAWRFPREGQDENTWAQYVLAMERANIGLNTCKLYDDAGTLKISKGRIGIDDNTQPSICEIDTITIIALTGTNSIWQEVYMTVSATAVDFDTVDLAGATDWSELPTTFTGAYDEEKEGYYRNPARRCIGIVWVDSAGNLEGIINTESGIEGYNGYSYYDSSYENTKIMWRKIKDTYKKWLICQLGDWDMVTTGTLNITHNLTDLSLICAKHLTIRDDNGAHWNIYRPYDPGGGSYELAGRWNVGTTQFEILRRGGSDFDDTDFNATSYNRGWIWLEFSES